MVRPLHARLLALAIAVLLAGACGSNAAVASAESSAGVAGDASGASDVTDAQAELGPDVRVLNAGSLEGKDVVVWFWAEW